MRSSKKQKASPIDIPAPPSLEEEIKRLAILDSYDILDSEEELSYDDLAQFAASVCEAPIALISLVGADRQWFKARVNCDVKESPRKFSFCSYAIEGREIYIVPDLQADPRFTDNPFVFGEPHVRFYAGMPLLSPEGYALGTLCVLDFVLRALTQDQQDAMRILGQMVMTKLELRRKRHQLADTATVHEMIEAALQDSERRARLLSDAFSPIHWSMKADLSNFQASNRWLEFSGITAEQLARNGWFSTVHPDDREWSLKEIQWAFSQGIAHEARMRLLHHDGSWRWMLVRSVPLKSASGEIIRWLGTNVDIDEQYSAQLALQTSEERLRLALEAGDLGTWDVSLATGVIVTCERGRSQLGLSHSTFTIDQALAQIVSEDRERVKAEIMEAVKGNSGLYSVEFRVRWPDGSIHWLASNGRVQFVGEGNERRAIRATGINRNITARRSSELALETKNRLLETVSNSLRVFLANADWSKALRGLLSFSCEQTASLYGFVGVLTDDRDELRILAFQGLTEPADASPEFIARVETSYREKGFINFDNFKNLLGSVLLTGEVVASNNVASDPRSGDGLAPGHPALHTFLGVPIWSGGEVVGMIALANRFQGYTGLEQITIEMLVQQAGVFCDSYRQNERKEALRRDHDSLELQLRHSQKMDAIGQLAGGVAHDFNNLLTVITGHAELSLMQHDLAEPERESLLQIAMAGERAAQLTRQLLTFSRRQLFQPRPLELNSTILEIVKMLQRMVGEQITIETQLSEKLSLIEADAGMIEQVLMNLVVNARDAMDSVHGGQVIIKTGNCFVDGFSCEMKPGGKIGPAVWISVTDSGCGIPPEILSRIFEPFYTTKEVGSGTGLGLATVYGIVQQHGGWIEVESRVGIGTTFTTLFPATKSNIQASVEITKPHSRGGSETILLVEDEEFVRTMARRCLEEKGYQVLEAASGREALDVWADRHGEISLLLTDMVMPGKLSGRDIADRLILASPGLPVIYTSGYSQELLQSGVELRSGINFLSKPYRPQELCDAIRCSLDQSTNALASKPE